MITWQCCEDTSANLRIFRFRESDFFSLITNHHCSWAVLLIFTSVTKTTHNFFPFNSHKMLGGSIILLFLYRLLLKRIEGFHSQYIQESTKARVEGKDELRESVLSSRLYNRIVSRNRRIGVRKETLWRFSWRVEKCP